MLSAVNEVAGASTSDIADVAVVVDSSVGLTQDLAADAGYHVVPFQLVIEGRSLADGVEISGEEFFGSLDTYEHLPQTSAPSPGAWLEVFADLWDHGKSVLAITCASSMTASHQSALIAAEDADAPTVVVDSRQASAGELLVASAGLRAVRAGAGLEKAAKVAEDVANRVTLLGTIMTFKFLKRSGRVNALEAFAAGALGINPVFVMHDGSADSFAKTRGREASLQKIVDTVHSEATAHDGDSLHVSAMHAACRNEGEWLLDAVADLHPVESTLTEFTPVMGVHTGPGLCGLGWWWEPPEGLLGGDA